MGGCGYCGARGWTVHDWWCPTFHLQIALGAPWLAFLVSRLGASTAVTVGVAFAIVAIAGLLEVFGRRQRRLLLFRRDLPGILTASGIAAAEYRFTEHRAGDGVVLPETEIGWVVYRSDRGARRDLRVHDSEDAACRDFLRRLQVEPPT